MPGTEARVDVQLGVVRPAAELADELGEVLTTFVRTAILSAASAVQAGRGHLLPQKADQRRLDPPLTQQERDSRRTTSLRYKAAEGEQARCWDAILDAGSTPALVTTSALRSYVAARGDRLDVRFVWSPRRRATRTSHAGAA